MGRHSKPEFPGARRSGATTDTGTHRAVGREAAPRGVAKWPFAILAVLAVLGAGVFAVMWGTNSLNSTADAEDGQCVEGRRTLRVTAPPRLVEPLTTVGDQWNTIDRVVDGHCVSVEINGAKEDEAMKAISQQDGVLAVPAVWIAESVDAGDRLTESNPKRVATTTKPLMSGPGYLLPYIVIDGNGVDEVQQRAAQEFRDYLAEPESAGVLKKAGFTA